ncbi:MAG: hypothetical protein KDE15_12330 [Erythrobacter sp.]|nr:hypothetical protein [Erythrobacter sp.]
MTRLLLPLTATLFLLSACSNGTPATDNPSPGGGGAPAASPSPSSAPPGEPADGVNDGYPDLSPVPLTPEAERSETGAREAVIVWARAIELQEWDQAWAMMSAADQARWNSAQFAALFADLSDVLVAVPGGTMEGAAGSSFYTVPTTITGTDRAGHPVRYEGEVVLRRVNDVPGATPEQLRWHIEGVTLEWTH